MPKNLLYSLKFVPTQWLINDDDDEAHQWQVGLSNYDSANTSIFFMRSVLLSHSSGQNGNFFETLSKVVVIVFV